MGEMEKLVILEESDVTPEMENTWFEEAEKGELYTGLTEVVRPRGRQPKYAEKLIAVNTRLTPEQRALVDASARKHGETRSDFIREAVNLLLAQRGELAPA